MKKLALIIVVSLVMVSLASAQTKTADATVFGLQLGAKFSVPECPFEDIGYGSKGYITPPKEMCFEQDDDLAGQPVSNDTVSMRFPEGGSPSITTGFHAVVIDGVVEEISFATAGLSIQDQVLATLKKKYGPPSSASETTKQNAFGAMFSSHSAVWHFANLKVTFWGSTDVIDHGLVEVQTKKGSAFRAAALKAASQSGPKM